MNLQHFISQPDCTVDYLKKTISEKGLIFKEWDDRILLTYPSQSADNTSTTTSSESSVKPDFNDPFTKECRGVILSKPTESQSSMKIICYSMDKLFDSSEFSLDELKRRFEAADGITEELYDGSLVKLYFYNGVWTVATNRCIEARKARWANYRTFFDLFENAAKPESTGECQRETNPTGECQRPRNCLDYTKLNPRCTYSFVLCHPENRIVVNYTEPKLIHVSTRNLDTFEETFENIGVEQPLQLKMDWDTFMERMSTNPYYMPGYVLKSRELNSPATRIVFESANYQLVKALKGNARDLIYRYLQLKREDSDKFQQFEMYFPEFKWIESQMETLAREAHRSYLEFFVNHNKQQFTHRDLWELLSELHTLFLRTREPTSLMKVRQHLKSYPLDKLARLLKMN